MEAQSASEATPGGFVPEEFACLLVERFGKSGVTSRIVENYKTCDLPSDGMTVKVSHAGLTVNDAMVCQGKSGAVREYPAIPGTDLAGTILQLDEESERCGFRVGDRVVATGGELGQSRSGGYSQIARVPAELAWRLPEALSNLRAVQLGTAAMTAALACMEIERGDLAASVSSSSPFRRGAGWNTEKTTDNSVSAAAKSGAAGEGGLGEQKSDSSSDRRNRTKRKSKKKKSKGVVLVSGASGSVGSFATHLLAERGYRVIGVTRHLEKQNRLVRFGARESLILEDFVKQCAEDGALGQETYVGVVDVLGDGFLDKALPRLVRGGVCVSVGSMRGPTTQISLAPFIKRGVRLVGVDSRYISPALRAVVWERLVRDISPTLFTRESECFATCDMGQIQPLSGRKLSSGAAPVSCVVVLGG